MKHDNVHNQLVFIWNVIRPVQAGCVPFTLAKPVKANSACSQYAPWLAINIKKADNAQRLLTTEVFFQAKHFQDTEILLDTVKL